MDTGRNKRKGRVKINLTSLLTGMHEYHEYNGILYILVPKAFNVKRRAI